MSDVVADRPVIKPNEEFTLKYLDDMVPAAQSWKLKNAVTGAVVAQGESGTSAKFTVPTEVHTTSLLWIATVRKVSSVVR